MKSKLLIFVMSMGMVVPLRAMAAPQDLDRINSIVDQARGLADSARSAAPGWQQQTTAQQSEFKNPFARDDSPSMAPAKNANNDGGEFGQAVGPSVAVDNNQIRVNAGGRQFAIPRAPVAGVGMGSRGENAGASNLLYYPPGYRGDVGIGGGVGINAGISLHNRKPSQPSFGTTSVPSASRALSMAAGYGSYADAVLSFRNADFAKATTLIKRAESTGAEKRVLYPFHSLCLFAEGDYVGAAEKAYAATATSATAPLWSWQQLSGFYGNPDAYSGQYRKLQDAAKDPNADKSVRFLLGYHHLMLGHRQDASEQFEQVLKQLPNDPVITQLLALARQAPPTPVR